MSTFRVLLIIELYKPKTISTATPIFKAIQSSEKSLSFLKKKFYETS